MEKYEAMKLEVVEFEVEDVLSDMGSNQGF